MKITRSFVITGFVVSPEQGIIALGDQDDDHKGKQIDFPEILEDLKPHTKYHVKITVEAEEIESY